MAAKKKPDTAAMPPENAVAQQLVSIRSLLAYDTRKRSGEFEPGDGTRVKLDQVAQRVRMDAKGAMMIDPMFDGKRRTPAERRKAIDAWERFGSLMSVATRDQWMAALQKLNSMKITEA